MIFYSRQTIQMPFKNWWKLVSEVASNDFEIVEKFEQSIKKELGVKYVVTGASMRDLLGKVLSYYVQNTGKKKVILGTYNHFSNLNAILSAGGEPVFVETENINLEADSLNNVNDKDVMGVIVTHVHGVASDMEKWERLAAKKKWLLFEDCAHSFGVTHKNQNVGTFGVGLFSFGLGKIVTAFGGGAVTTQDQKLFEYLKKEQCQRENIIKFNVFMWVKGWLYSWMTTSYVGALCMKIIMGVVLCLDRDELLVEKTLVERQPKMNSKVKRLTDMQASVGLVYLAKYRQENKKRLANARLYNSVLNIYKISDQNIYFHYLYKVADKKKVKWIGWRLGVDIQDDYCEDVKKVYNGETLTKRESGIVYLPTNPEIPGELIKKVAVACKNM